jgi:hypothetical protein
LRTSLDRPDRRDSTNAVVADVAAHRLDPYTAADRLLGDISVE